MKKYLLAIAAMALLIGPAAAMGKKPADNTSTSQPGTSTSDQYGTESSTSSTKGTLSNPAGSKDNTGASGQTRDNY